jgi:hypothetical protein
MPHNAPAPETDASVGFFFTLDDNGNWWTIGLPSQLASAFPATSAGQAPRRGIPMSLAVRIDTLMPVAVRPGSAVDARHLRSGSEVRPWLPREPDRVQPA